MFTTTHRPTGSVTIETTDGDLFGVPPGAAPHDTQPIHTLLVARRPDLVCRVAGRHAGHGTAIEDPPRPAHLGLMLPIRCLDADHGHDSPRRPDPASTLRSSGTPPTDPDRSGRDLRASAHRPNP